VTNASSPETPRQCVLLGILETFHSSSNFVMRVRAASFSATRSARLTVSDSTVLHGSGDVPKLEPGAALEGWALTCGRTPAQLFVLIEGIVIGSTTDFLPRADVNEVMHTMSPASWRVTANTLGVSPGERVLQLAVRIEPRSDIRIVREQRVNVIKPGASRRDLHDVTKAGVGV
jgi:hypothetical protein